MSAADRRWFVTDMQTGEVHEEPLGQPMTPAEFTRGRLTPTDTPPRAAEPNNNLGLLDDLTVRLLRAERELRDMARDLGPSVNDWLAHKADGVRLALSYVEEAIRLTLTAVPPRAAELVAAVLYAEHRHCAPESCCQANSGPDLVEADKVLNALRDAGYLAGEADR